MQNVCFSQKIFKQEKYLVHKYALNITLAGLKAV